jgi:hypothetical protein
MRGNLPPSSPGIPSPVSVREPPRFRGKSWEASPTPYSSETPLFQGFPGTLGISRSACHAEGRGFESLQPLSKACFCRLSATTGFSPARRRRLSRLHGRSSACCGRHPALHANDTFLYTDACRRDGTRAVRPRRGQPAAARSCSWKFSQGPLALGAGFGAPLLGAAGLRRSQPLRRYPPMYDISTFGSAAVSAVRSSE